MPSHRALGMIGNIADRIANPVQPRGQHMRTISTSATPGGFRGVIRDENEEIVAQTTDFATFLQAYAAARELRDCIEAIEAQIAQTNARLLSLGAL